MSEKLVLIDGHSILNRAFYGIRVLTNSRGVATNAVTGFMNTLLMLEKDVNPDMIAVAFDLTTAIRQTARVCPTTSLNSSPI